ncbi:MAG: toprim domain-containing protein, partial [Rikenellaceae bacterium]
TGLTIKRESGGYWDRFAGRVIFPILSISGRVIGFGGRILTSDKKKAKYLNSPESDIYHKSNTLYGIFQAKRAISAQNKCILVEGYTDVISMHQSGIENVVASSGTSLTIEQIILIRRFTHNVTIIYDGDAAGIKASLRGINMVLKEGLNVRIVLLPDGEDPDSFARAHSASETYQYINDHEEDFISFKTKLLLDDAKNDPIAKAGVIHDIVDSISVISDEIVRAQYIKECSRLLDADESMLSREVMRQIVSLKGGKEALEVYNNQQHKKQVLEERKRPLKANKDRSSLFEMEKELITYLLKNGNENFKFIQPRQEPIELNIAEVIIEEMQIDGLTFLEPVYNTIFEEYVRLFTEDKNVQINHFINHSDSTVCDFVVDLLTYDDLYKQSKIWSKHTKMVIDHLKLSDAIPKCIALYKLKRLEYLISERKEELRYANDNSMEILKDINALNESRNAVCMKYERIL